MVRVIDLNTDNQYFKYKKGKTSVKLFAEISPKVLASNSRVTTTYIAHIIRYTGLRRDLEKLPKSNKLIEENIEKLDDFHRRKIQSVIKQLINEGNDLKRYVILDKACIPRKYYNCYDYYIQSTIEEEIKSK